MTVVVCEPPQRDWVWNQGGKCSELWHFCSSWTHKITTHSWCLLVALFWSFVVIASENILKKVTCIDMMRSFFRSAAIQKCQIFLGISFTKLYSWMTLEIFSTHLLKHFYFYIFLNVKAYTPWKINMEPTNHPFWKENDLPNLHDYVPC